MRSIVALSLGMVLSAQAQEAGRDPTAWPPALRSALAAASAASEPAGEPPGVAIRHVVFTGGRAYVVQRGRRHAVGDLLDGARIERITEQAVWLREAGQLRREPLYGGVEKRPPPSAAPAPAAKNSKEKQP
jgi:hypothetical protein